MSNQNFKPVKIDSSVRHRTFSYVKGEVKLEFSLRTDIKQQLKDFLELLEVAVKEVKGEIDTKNVR